MSKQTTPEYLSERQKIRYQQKLAYFLKKYRSRNKLQSKDMADKLGYTPTRYGQLESDTKPHPRFIGAINFLASIYTLDSHMSLVEFVNFLEGQSNRVESDGSTLKRSLHDWEKKILMSLDSVDRNILNNFIDDCSKSLNKDPELMEKKLELLNLISGLSSENLLNLIKIVKNLRNT